MMNKLLTMEEIDDEEEEDILVNGEAESLEPQGFAPSTSDDSLDDDPEFIELQEREQIVDKYERGPDQKDVDPWENPDFELYKVTDRYGFVHKGELENSEQIEYKRIQKELKRETKWLRMLDEWKQRHPTKLPERIWKGVPDKLRLVIWMRLLGVADMKASARENLYQELLMRARLVSKDIKQIDLDINRTYRNNLAFRKRYDVKQQSLFNVLTAYAMLNTEVGYCQGMSQIAAVFLMYMDEEDSFWCMHALLVNRKFTMHGFFVPGFPKLHRFQNHYDKVLLKYLPRVKKHLDNTGIPPIYLTKWWFGCFLDRVPFSLALRIWDVFLYYGDCILIAMAYNIMKMHRRTIMKLTIEDFMEYIQTTLANDFGFTDDRVMESLEECLRKLQNDRMALPPPPNPRDASEIPTKTLGPILTRSMLDIRSDIAEVYSRCSRANSLAGRSPAVTVKRLQSQNHQERLIATAAVHAFNKNNKAHEIIPPVEPFLRRVGSTKDKRNKPPPVPDEDGFVRMSPRQKSKQIQHQYEQQEAASTVFTPLSAVHKRQISQYDNVISSSPASNTTTNASKSKTASSSAAASSQPRSSSLKNYTQRAPVTPFSIISEHRREISNTSVESRHRVHRTANNVTVVALETGDDEITTTIPRPPMPAVNHFPIQQQQHQHNSNVPGLPYCPPPDYPGASNIHDGFTKQQRKSSLSSSNCRFLNNGVPVRDLQRETTEKRQLLERQIHTKRQQQPSMAKTLYSNDETTVIRRF